MKAHELLSQPQQLRMPPAVQSPLTQPLQERHSVATMPATGSGSGPASLPLPSSMRPPEVCTVDTLQSDGAAPVAPSILSGAAGVVLPPSEPTPPSKKYGAEDGSGSESGSGSVVVLDQRAPGRTDPLMVPLAHTSSPTSTLPALHTNPQHSAATSEN